MGSDYSEQVALAEALLALGVKRFVSDGFEVEFHDAAVGRAMLQSETPSEDPFDAAEAARHAKRAEEEAKHRELEVLFRGVG